MQALWQLDALGPLIAQFFREIFYASWEPSTVQNIGKFLKTYFFMPNGKMDHFIF